MKSTANPQELLERFWRELSQVRTGMLGLAHDAEGRAQPMTALAEADQWPLWFLGRKDSALAHGSHHPTRASFHYASRGHDLYACVHGELCLWHDPLTVERLWSEEAQRWFPGGPHDADLALLRFDPDGALIWLPNEGYEPHTYGFGGRAKDVRAEVHMHAPGGASFAP